MDNLSGTLRWKAAYTEPEDRCVSAAAYCGDMNNAEATIHNISTDGQLFGAKLRYLETLESGEEIYEYLSHFPMPGTTSLEDNESAVAAVASTTFGVVVSYHAPYATAMDRKNTIEENIRNFADGVFEASNGAHKIGRVTIFTDGANADRADIVWVERCWPAANVNGRWTPGNHSPLRSLWYGSSVVP